MKRGGRPRGSITARVPVRPVKGEDGKPLARVYDVTLRVPNGEDAFGGTTYKTYRKRSCTSRKAANDELARMIAELADGSVTPGPRDEGTAAAYVAQYIDRKQARGDIREVTAEGYRLLWRKHIAPGLGSKKLTALTPGTLQGFIDSLTARLAPRSIKHLWAVIDGALAEAVALRLIGRNPCDGVRLPKVRASAIPETTTEEVQRVLDAAEEPWRSLFTLMALTGVRRSEALGLTWGAVDLDEGVIRIRQGLHRVNGRLILTPPKTDRGRRDIPIGPSGVALLRRVKAQQSERLLKLGAAADENTAVFANELGDFRDPDAVTGAFRKAAKAAGVKVTLHGIRHFSATRLIDEGIDPATVSDILGHGSAAFTLSTYVRSRKDAMRRGTAAIEDAFARANGKG